MVAKRRRRVETARASLPGAGVAAGGAGVTAHVCAEDGGFLEHLVTSGEGTRQFGPHADAVVRAGVFAEVAGLLEVATAARVLAAPPVHPLQARRWVDKVLLGVCRQPLGPPEGAGAVAVQTEVGPALAAVVHAHAKDPLPVVGVTAGSVGRPHSRHDTPPHPRAPGLTQLPKSAADPLQPFDLQRHSALAWFWQWRP